MAALLRRYVGLRCGRLVLAVERPVSVSLANGCSWSDAGLLSDSTFTPRFLWIDCCDCQWSPNWHG